MRLKSPLLLFAVLTMSGCGTDEENAAAADNFDVENMILDAEAASSEPTSPQRFADGLAANDRFEVEASRLVITSGKSDDVKKFADDMIRSHVASTRKLKATLAKGTAPSSVSDKLNSTQERLIASLKSKRGSELDAAYRAAQVDAHESMLDMLHTFAASGDDPTLKKLASDLIPTVTAHLRRAQSLE